MIKPLKIENANLVDKIKISYSKDDTLYKKVITQKDSIKDIIFKMRSIKVRNIFHGKDRNETGGCINFGGVALAMVIVVVLGPEMEAALSSVGPALRRVLFTLLMPSVINDKMNNNLCDLEGS